ncbi:LacI family transcriptional regulator [Microbacterium resistens]|nr:LacI family transcriptional regulator [Microbacterium resistens]
MRIGCGAAGIPRPDPVARGAHAVRGHSVSVVTGKRRSATNPVTIGDIARVAGVSRSTVSRAFSRPEMLSGETVHRVRAAADQLGYVVNHAARALSTGRFGNIAVVVPDIANPFFPPLVRRVQTLADQADYAVFLGDSDEIADREANLTSRLSAQVEGFVLAAPRLDEQRIRELDAQRPVVLVNRDIEGLARVLIDPSGGLDEAVAHLHRLGHRRVVYLSGPRESWSDQQRRAALNRAAERVGIEVAVQELGRPSSTGGRDAVGGILASGATAVIAFDDVVAQGVLAGLALRGIAVPRDISVIGCDDTLASGTNPALTTISAASAAAGEAAAELLLARLADAERPAERVAIATHLVVRETTDAARPAARE